MPGRFSSPASAGCRFSGNLGSDRSGTGSIGSSDRRGGGSLLATGSEGWLFATASKSIGCRLTGGAAGWAGSNGFGAVDALGSLAAGNKPLPTTGTRGSGPGPAAGCRVAGAGVSSRSSSATLGWSAGGVGLALGEAPTGGRAGRRPAELATDRAGGWTSNAGTLATGDGAGGAEWSRGADPVAGSARFGGPALGRNCQPSVGSTSVVSATAGSDAAAMPRVAWGAGTDGGDGGRLGDGGRRPGQHQRRVPMIGLFGARNFRRRCDRGGRLSVVARGWGLVRGLIDPRSLRVPDGQSRGRPGRDPAAPNGRLDRGHDPRITGQKRRDLGFLSRCRATGNRYRAQHGKGPPREPRGPVAVERSSRDVVVEVLSVG